MQELLKEIDVRRARRALSEKTVPEDSMNRILTAATYAPSCANKQPWRFVVIDKEPELSKVKESLAGGNYWAKKAPVVLLAATKEELDCRLSDQRDYALFDTGLAVMNLVLQATKEGLIAHPIAGFEPEPIKKDFGIPEDYTLITLVIIGYPGDDSHLSDKHKEQERDERSRKPLSEVVSSDKWGF